MIAQVSGGNGDQTMSFSQDDHGYGRPGLYGFSLKILPTDYTSQRVVAFIHPANILPKYQKRLDALTAEYRKKGLSI